MEQKSNPVKAIREFCIDCCGGSRETVKNCPSVKCSLYPFRMGKNPFRKREMSEEQRKAAGDRLREARKNNINNAGKSEENDD